MLKLNRVQIEKLLSSDGKSRYEFSVKKIVDWEEAWGLYEDGWTMLADEEGNLIFPIWPAKDFAMLCVPEENARCAPKDIFLDDLMDDLLPRLADDNIKIGVFDVSGSSDTPVVKASDFLRDLTIECSKY